MDSSLLEGMWIVVGPTFSTSLLMILVFAKVPRAMISSFPLLLPYELKSSCLMFLSIKYLAAGEFFEILPAGEMWSVVMESPRFKRQ